MFGAAKNDSFKVAVVTVAALLAAFAVLLSSTGDAEAKKKKKAVTRTFANPAVIATPGSGPAALYPSEISVGASGKVLDVDVRLNRFTHRSTDDIDAMLVGPRGQCAVVQSDAGAGTQVINLDFILDDEAASPLLGTSQPPADYRYKPTNVGDGDAFPAPALPACSNSALSVFDGTDPNGDWKLFVVDDADGASGQYAGGWSLTLKLER